MQRLTKEQAIVLTGFTGITCCNFSHLHGDVGRRLGRLVWSHEFASEEFAKKVKELYREDFIKLYYEETEKCE